MRFLLIFFLVFTFSCSEDSVTNNPDNNGGNSGGDNNNSGPSGNVFSFEDIDPLGQWDFDESRVQLNKINEPIKKDIKINIVQRDYDDSLDVGIINVYPPLSGELGANETITCYVGNYGYLPIFEDFQVSYKIAFEDGEFGEEVFETYTITDSLASVDYTTFSFSTTADLSQFGSYTIEVSTHMPDDMDPETDSFTRVVESLQYTDICNLHSLILNEDNTFSLYTTNEEGITNYVILGTYDLNQENNSVTLNVVESDGSNTIIGELYDVDIDENGLISGTVNIEGLCVQVLEGYEEESYYAGLTYIPDIVFEEELISMGYDNQLDNYVITSNLDQITAFGIEATNLGMDENGDNIWTDRLTSLAGIEALPNLEFLQLVGNDLDSINLTQNPGLKYFYANFNQFKSVNTSYNSLLHTISIDGNGADVVLDFTNNPDLVNLSVPTCDLTELDLSENPNIEFLDLYNNQLTNIITFNMPNLREVRLQWNNIESMDLSNNLLLESLALPGNQLEGTLDVSMCENLNELNVSMNPGLTCIKVNAFQLNAIETNDPEYDWSYDSGVTLSLDCN